MNIKSLKFTALREILCSSNRAKGQTFVEFLFLMIVLIGLSTIMLRGINGGVASRWLQYTHIIEDVPQGREQARF